ncbi:DUF47 domain-containing protein [Desulfomonile tiedjei]|uniref:Phosphate transport regulator related to PhoU n=1 Tax=Desulfomonile tiedjei (strain ATCC 49306 / DSM 6799 / DCB-1) TaxID=706587 RepID=I4CBB0_DESTA|nr:DUF47 family protein [Desulfomonile tiedjei]AFM26851.1 phosphate transport regulator related to PhoU [Desulfomonile tiedjei DSM 6799]
MAFWKLFSGRRETDFYELLLLQAEKTLAGCAALVAFLDEQGEPETLRRLEQEADDIRRILIDELNQTFLTPMDREDIFALSRAIDDVMDHAYNTVKEMEVFEIEPNEFLFQMAELLQQGAEQLVNAIRHLKKNPNVAVEYAVRAKRIENKINDVFLAALKQLFCGHEPRIMFSYREIYRHFNRSADRVDEAANIISDIVVKMY